MKNNIEVKRKINKKGINGITLIALVITIIVLLILAGISISMLSGDNSLLKKTGEAKDRNNQGIEKEQLDLAVLASIETDGKLSLDKIKNNIEGNISNATHDYAENFPLTVTYTNTGNSYEIDGEGKVKVKLPGPIVTHTIDPTEEGEHAEVIITLNSTPTEGTTVTKITKPDGTVVENTKSITYKVTENETYKFIVESSNGGKTEYEVKITNAKDIEKFSDIYETTTKITSADGKEVWVPGGYAVGVTALVNNVSKGLVITDSIKEDHTSNGNEFVWIPVSDSSDMYGVLADGTKVGKLYTKFSGTKDNAKADKLNWDYDSNNSGRIKIINNSNWKEPDILYNQNTDGETDSLAILNNILGTSFNTKGKTINTNFKMYLQHNFDSMIDRVEDRKGFYVGRYETKVDRVTIDGKTKYIVKSKKGERSTTAADTYDGTNTNKWYGLYAEQQQFKTDTVQGNMIWGCQYDQIMKWLQKNNIDVSQSPPKGFERNNGEAYTSSSRRPSTTGTVESDKLNNIYDLLGNAKEYSMERCEDYYRAARGGEAGYSVQPSNRLDITPYSNLQNYGSRMALYVK